MDIPGLNRVDRPALRAALLATRATFDDAARAALDGPLRRRLASLPVLRRTIGAVPPGRAPVIGLYFPMRQEPDLRPLAALWRRRGIVTALPAMIGRDPPAGSSGGPPGGLRYLRYDDQSVLATGRFGVVAPAGDDVVLPDLLVAPCVGFTRHDGRLYRLGYGGGYFDRTLAWRAVPCIGVGYDALELAAGAFVPQATDAPLAAVVTPSRSIAADSV